MPPPTPAGISHSGPGPARFTVPVPGCPGPRPAEYRVREEAGQPGPVPAAGGGPPADSVQRARSGPPSLAPRLLSIASMLWRRASLPLGRCP